MASRKPSEQPRTGTEQIKEQLLAIERADALYGCYRTTTPESTEAGFIISTKPFYLATPMRHESLLLKVLHFMLPLSATL